MTKRKTKAWAISDRSGLKFHLNEMIYEPGTGVFLHKSESDGMYNAVDHPQANLQKYSPPYNDPQPLWEVRLEVDQTLDLYLQDSLGNYITDSMGNRITI
jgi:hypothetical protein